MDGRAQAARWDAADERQLAELLDRKIRFEEAHKGGLARAAVALMESAFGERNYDPADLVRVVPALRGMAKQMRDALAPFDDGERPPEEMTECSVERSYVRPPGFFSSSSSAWLLCAAAGKAARTARARRSGAHV